MFRNTRESFKFTLQTNRNWSKGRFQYHSWPVQHDTWITGLAMDAQHVVTGSNDRTLVVWDRLSRQWSHILKGHSGYERRS